jgi:hypothetical protein
LKKFIISIIIIAVVIGAFYYLRYYFDKENVALWDLVPGNSIAVYEVEDPADIWFELKELPLWSNLSSIPTIKTFDAELDHMDTLLSGEGNLSMLLSDMNFLISFHKISNNNLGIVFYFPVNSTEKRRKLNDIFLHYNSLPDARYGTRNYHAMNIHEISFSENGMTFSYLEYKNFLIGSFTPFLIDDVIRNIFSGFELNFRTEIGDIFQHKPIETDQGNIYVNINRIPDLMSIVATPALEKRYESFLKWLAEASYYDISFEGNQIFLNGSVSVPPDRNEYFLTSFYNQEPQPLGLISYLPNFTATYLSYTFSDFKSWRSSIDAYWQVNFPDQLKKKTAFFNENSLHEPEFYSWIGNEIGLATVQSIDIDNPDKLVFIASMDPDAGLSELDDLTASRNQANGDTLLYEVYGDKMIKKLNLTEFPSIILGEAFTGFESSYYTAIDGYVVIGNSFDVIKMMMNDLEEENTWGKSLNFVRFFENIQKKANLSYFVNFSNVWNSFYGSLNDSWKEFFRKYDYQFKHFEQVSFQFSNINNHIYTSAALQHRPGSLVAEIPASFSKDQVIYTENPVITKPFVVKNHLDRSLEVVIQDSASNLYLISSQGEILWQDSIGQKMKGELFQIDYFNNNKLQYFFATDLGLHIIDRNGEYIDGFPVIFQEPVNVEWVNLIDYDNSKRYRILLGDNRGRIFLFNKQGELLEGWGPKEFATRFSSVPFHLRIGGRDCMIAFEEKGSINLMTRRGEFYKGFPVIFDQVINSPVFVQRGTDFNRTLIHLVLENGEINKCNLQGEVINKKQLYRPGKDSYFEIIQDVLSNTYVICRQDYNNISILRSDGEVIFEKELLFSEKLEVQFYSFSAGNEIYTFTDKQQGFTYLFDGNGNLINQRPVESGHRIALIYSEVNNKFQLYSCYGNQFSKSSFYRK